MSLLTEFHLPLIKIKGLTYTLDMGEGLFTLACE